MRFIIDPRDGDIEDDVSSTKRHSLWSLAGSLLVEVSFAKLLAAWLILVAFPGAMLGLAPLVATAWLSAIAHKVAAVAGIASVIALGLILVASWMGFRHLFRIVERSFWSLNALLVQPVYALARESIRHAAEFFLSMSASDARRERSRAAGSVVAGILVFLAAAAFTTCVWDFTQWSASVSDLAAPHRLLPAALANMTLLVVGYLGAGSLFWGLADATMEQPRSAAAAESGQPSIFRWRVAHLSDVHMVGERFGYRIECGRDGPRGNQRFDRVLTQLEAIHTEDPLDYILITGDLTDAGRASEWAEFLSAMARHPELLERTLVVPGNHDLNVVDRANPARLELPTSPGKRLRQMRTLSAICGIQGGRVHIIDPKSHKVGPSLETALQPHRDAIKTFSDAAGLSLSWRLARVWSDTFPLVVPPPSEDGLGVILLNSNAEANFSFTNALGLVPFEDARALVSLLRAHPKGHWIIALHHHLVEYPMPVAELSERIGTALINGSWLVRELKPFARRITILHGHRHIDWRGACGPLRIISAPSPVMPMKGSTNSSLYVRIFAATADGLVLASSAPITLAEEIETPKA
jgi:hypothetical protein